MRSFLLTSGLAALAAAAPAPAPQDIEFDLVYALPNPTYTIAADVTAQAVTYTQEAIYTEALPQITATNEADAMPDTTGAPNNKRAAASCTALPSGYGPVPTPDTVAAFKAVPDFANNALQAATPSGYTQAFSNLNASNNAYGYLGFTTFKTYDVAGCAARCNGIKGCMSFNIYYERDPSIDPGAGDECSNPSSTTMIKCAFWGGPLTTANANNVGQWRNKFQVVIAGSNGYVSNAIASVPGYGTAIPLGNAAINAPYDSLGFDSYMGVAIFTDGPFDASLCARACSEKSAYAIAHPPTDGSPVQTCQFFNTYILYINTTSNLQGQYCAMYSESWPKSYATNVGQYRGNDRFLIQYSFAYSNATNPGKVDANAAIHQASRDVSYSTLQPFCSSYLGYTIPSTTTTTTITSAPVTTTTTTAVTTTTVTSTTLSPARRDEEDTPDYPASILAAMRPPNAPTLVEKRALSTPAVLTKYPTQILSAACSLQATPATVTSTIVSTTVTTLPVSTTTTTTSTTATATALPSICGFRLKVSAPGTPYDGAYVQQPDSTYYFFGVSTDNSYKNEGPRRYCLDPNTGYVTSPKGLYLGRWAGYSNYRYPVMQAINSAGPEAPDGAAACAIDAATGQFTCSIAQNGGTFAAWYVTTNSLTQISLGTAGLSGTFGQSRILTPATLYVEF